MLIMGSPSGGRICGRAATREGWAERFGVAGPVVPKKPGKFVGGKGPQLKTIARSETGVKDWR
jgi:hypothetical protein